MNMMLLSKQDIEQCISMRDAIAVMKKAFLQLANGEVIQPLRTLIPISRKEAATLTMPAYLKQEKQLGIKIVSSFPLNQQQNIPGIHGLIILLNADTGVPLALMEAGYLTALRTGAISGLATDLLASDDAKHLCIVGSGTQAYTQIEAVTAVRNIEKITVWSRHYENAVKFARSLEQKWLVKPKQSIQEAVKDADIICTATQSTEPLIYYSDIKPNIHINAIGSHTKSMQEIGLDILQKAITIVDQKEAALAEAGEIIAAIKDKLLDVSQLIEIGQLVQASEPSFKQQLTLFKSVGLALQDISIAHFVYEKAMQNQLGLNFDLWHGINK